MFGSRFTSGMSILPTIIFCRLEPFSSWMAVIVRSKRKEPEWILSGIIVNGLGLRIDSLDLIKSRGSNPYNNAILEAWIEIRWRIAKLETSYMEDSKNRSPSARGLHGGKWLLEPPKDNIATVAFRYRGNLLQNWCVWPTLFVVILSALHNALHQLLKSSSGLQTSTSQLQLTLNEHAHASKPALKYFGHRNLVTHFV